MTVDEAVEIFENLYNGDFATDTIFDLSDGTYVCEIYEPATKKSTIGVYGNIINDGEADENTLIKVLGIVDLNDEEQRIDQINALAETFVNYLNENNLTPSQFSLYEGFSYYESIKTDRFNMLVEEIKAKYSK